MQFLKKNFAIILAFLLPVVLIAGVALSVYLPSLFLATDYNFVYVSCTEGGRYYPYNCNGQLDKRYTVVDGRLVLSDIDPTSDFNNNRIPDSDENYVSRIFLHDTKKNESREITLEEAKKLTLNPLLTSPDGVTVSSDYSRSGGDVFFIFGRGSSYGYYLMKGNSKDRLNLINGSDEYYYRDNFKFIGWISPGRD